VLLTLERLTGHSLIETHQSWIKKLSHF
jgi:hypothetical protein